MIGTRPINKYHEPALKIDHSIESFHVASLFTIFGTFSTALNAMIVCKAWLTFIRRGNSCIKAAMDCLVESFLTVRIHVCGVRIMFSH